jgi:hypothetical protein
MTITTPDSRESLAQDFTPIIELLDQRLQHGEALSEFDLMRWLQAPEQGIFQAGALSDNLTLFRSHFILMHCLYRLRQRWFDTRSATLTISALCIQRGPWSHGDDKTPDNHDPLAAYYLDIRELDTDREAIDELLTGFWKKMLLPDSPDDDLKILELSSAVTIEEIQIQYRRLVMRHHPDRGGDQHRFCQIQAAYQRLKNRYL